MARVMGRPFISEHVYIGGGTVVENGATIKGPAWIGSNCEIRSGCYIRENVIVGDGVVLGNSCEFKNCIIFNDAEIPHFSYVGDSVLGYQAHLGAGVILSNVRLDHKEISVKTETTPFRPDFANSGLSLGIAPRSVATRSSVQVRLSVAIR